MFSLIQSEKFEQNQFKKRQIIISDFDKTQ